MKKNSIAYTFAVLMCCLACLISCGSKDAGFQQTEDGLSYKFHEVHPESPMPTVSDYLKLSMDYYLNDSLIYSSADQKECPRIQYQKPRFGGDIITGLGMMHVGDSASFVVRADSTMRYEIKLLQIQTKEEFQKELDSMVSFRHQVEETMSVLKAQSEQELETFLTNNDIKEKAAYNRVFVIPMKLGSGPKAAEGMKALITYEAYLLDGTFIGSSDSLGLDYYEVPIGKGKVLQGLDEGIARMSKGEKAKIVVPYALAYGENGTETIPPYTNLLFVVEMLDLLTE